MSVPIQTGALALAAGQSQSPQDGESGWLDGGEGDDRLWYQGRKNTFDLPIAANDNRWRRAA